MNAPCLQICPWVIEGRPGQRINLTLHDFSRPALCAAAAAGHEFIQITDGNRHSKTFDVCGGGGGGGGGGATQRYVTETQRVEIIFSSSGRSDERDGGGATSVFLLHYQSELNRREGALCPVEVTCRFRLGATTSDPGGAIPLLASK